MDKLNSDEENGQFDEENDQFDDDNENMSSVAQTSVVKITKPKKEHWKPVEWREMARCAIDNPKNCHKATFDKYSKHFVAHADSNGAEIRYIKEKAVYDRVQKLVKHYKYEVEQICRTLNVKENDISAEDLLAEQLKLDPDIPRLKRSPKLETGIIKGLQDWAKQEMAVHGQEHKFPLLVVQKKVVEHVYKAGAYHYVDLMKKHGGESKSKNAFDGRWIKRNLFMLTTTAAESNIDNDPDFWIRLKSKYILGYQIPDDSSHMAPSGEEEASSAEASSAIIVTNSGRPKFSSIFGSFNPQLTSADLITFNQSSYHSPPPASSASVGNMSVSGTSAVGSQKSRSISLKAYRDSPNFQLMKNATQMMRGGSGGGGDDDCSELTEEQQSSNNEFTVDFSGDTPPKSVCEESPPKPTLLASKELKNKTRKMSRLKSVANGGCLRGKLKSNTQEVGWVGKHDLSSDDKMDSSNEEPVTKKVKFSFDAEQVNVSSANTAIVMPLSLLTNSEAAQLNSLALAVTTSPADAGEDGDDAPRTKNKRKHNGRQRVVATTSSPVGREDSGDRADRQKRNNAMRQRVGEGSGTMVGANVSGSDVELVSVTDALPAAALVVVPAEVETAGGKPGQPHDSFASNGLDVLSTVAIVTTNTNSFDLLGEVRGCDVSTVTAEQVDTLVEPEKESEESATTKMPAAAEAPAEIATKPVAGEVQSPAAESESVVSVSSVVAVPAEVETAGGKPGQPHDSFASNGLDVLSTVATENTTNSDVGDGSGQFVPVVKPKGNKRLTKADKLKSKSDAAAAAAADDESVHVQSDSVVNGESPVTLDLESENKTKSSSVEPTAVVVSTEGVVQTTVAEVPEHVVAESVDGGSQSVHEESSVELVVDNESVTINTSNGLDFLCTAATDSEETTQKQEQEQEQTTEHGFDESSTGGSASVDGKESSVTSEEQAAVVVTPRCYSSPLKTTGSTIMNSLLAQLMGDYTSDDDNEEPTQEQQQPNYSSPVPTSPPVETNGGTVQSTSFLAKAADYISSCITSPFSASKKNVNEIPQQSTNKTRESYLPAPPLFEVEGGDIIPDELRPKVTLLGSHDQKRNQNVNAKASSTVAGGPFNNTHRPNKSTYFTPPPPPPPSHAAHDASSNSRGNCSSNNSKSLKGADIFAQELADIVEQKPSNEAEFEQLYSEKITVFCSEHKLSIVHAHHKPGPSKCNDKTESDLQTMLELLALSGVDDGCSMLLCTSSFAHMDLFSVLEKCCIAASCGRSLSKPFAVKDIRAGVIAWLNQRQNHMKVCNSLPLLEIFRLACLSKSAPSKIELSVCAKSVNQRSAGQVNALRDLMVSSAKTLLSPKTKKNQDWMNEVFLHVIVNCWSLEVQMINSEGETRTYTHCEDAHHFVPPVALNLMVMEGVNDGEFYGVVRGVWFESRKSLHGTSQSGPSKVKLVSVGNVKL
jgi:hypothetical protein